MLNKGGVRLVMSNLEGTRVEIYDAVTKALITEKESYGKASRYLGVSRNIEKRAYKGKEIFSPKLNKNVFLKEK